MSQVLRQSTQVIVVIGPFVDVTDGFTPETGITLSGADEAELLKSNTSTTTDISGATWAAITGCDGWYALTLTTSHTDTVGAMTVMVNDDSVCLPVFARFQVIEEALYDGIYAASAAVVPANTTQISGDSTAADNLETMLDGTGGQTLSLKQLNIVNSAGSALVASSTGSNGNGIEASGHGFGSGLRAIGGASGNGIEAEGGASGGKGVEVYGPAGIGVNISSDTGTGLSVQAGGNEHGVVCAGSGSGSGMVVLGGDTGHGIFATGGETSGDGLRATATSGDGLNATLSAALLATFFSKNSGTTYAGAVAGSVVKEIADNAGGASLTVADIADGVWDEATSGHTTTGTFGKLAADVLEDTGTTLQSEVDGIQADTEDIQSRLPAALVSGRIDASVGAMAAGVVTAAAVGTNAIDADALAADAVTEIQSGLSTLDAAGVRSAVGLASANLDTQLLAIDDFLDTEVAAIKTQTDKLTFNASNYVAANTRQDFTGSVATDAGNSATTFKTDRTETNTDHWRDSFVRITSGVLNGQVRLCTAYDGTTKFITVQPAFSATPADGVTFDIVNE